MYKNNIDLIGFLGSDPEARYTSNGTAVTTFSLATKSSWKNEAGTYDSEETAIPVVYRSIRGVPP
jgi:single-strand DNA-binding protein